MTKFILSLTLLLTASTLLPAADGEFPGIEALMTNAEQRAAGIENLSPQQIDALNAWIERYATGAVAAPLAAGAASVTTPVAASTASAAASPATATLDDFRQPSPRIDFVARIAGNFEGWSGRTRFTLENGQVWEQRRGNRWKISLDRPEVRIRENFMGAFEMEVISEGRSIGVRRIR